MKNNEVANILYEIADFLELKDVEFKPRAYRRAARNIEALNEDIDDINNRGELETIDGIGESIAEKIEEYLETGSLAYYEDLKDDLPIDIDAITRVESIGPKKAKKLYDELGIADLDDLQAAATAGEIATIDGFGEKSQQNILDHIELARQGEERMLLGRAFPLVAEVEETLADHEAFQKVLVVGSFRRRRPTVGDIDILAISPSPDVAMEIFTRQPDVTEVLSVGDTRSSIRVSGDLQMDLRLVSEESYGAAMQYFTGSKDHNITTRNRAIERGWKLNEYGLFDGTEERIAGETEAGVYDALGLDWIPPELREDTGEVEAAANDDLPSLIEIEDLKGDLHLHTSASDGSNTVLEMAQKAAELGHDYILISDHGPSLQVASGLTRDEFDDQAAEIEQANADSDVTILQGIEANIVDEGLDVSEQWLGECDISIFAIHDRLTNPTERIIEVIEDYPVDIFAHPHNRIINEREPIDLELEPVMAAAAEHNVILEINAQPSRLDLDWQSVKEYRDTITYSIGTDSHVTSSMEYLHLGVSQARRGWCEPHDILNTRPLDEVLKITDG